MSWYNNDEGFDQNKKNNYIRRFYMKNNTDTLITFIDEPIIELNGVKIQTPFKYNEYTLQLNGHWRNWFTQPFNQEDDVLAQMGYRASKVAALTVVDHTEWTDKNGNAHKDEVSLYIMKRSSALWKQLEKVLQREGSVSGKTYRVHRMGDKSPATGVMLEKHDQDFILGQQHKPFNYLEILAPKSRQELENLFNRDDPFKDQQKNQAPSSQHSWSNSSSDNNGWGGNGDSWNTNQPNNNQQNRVYGATSSSDPIPF